MNSKSVKDKASGYILHQQINTGAFAKSYLEGPIWDANGEIGGYREVEQLPIYAHMPMYAYTRLYVLLVLKSVDALLVDDADVQQ
jgi:hypothetical protein